MTDQRPEWCPWSGKRATNPNREKDRCPGCDQEVDVVSGPMGGEYANHRYRTPGTPAAENHRGLCHRAHPGVRHGEWERRRREALYHERGEIVFWHLLAAGAVLAVGFAGWRATHHGHHAPVAVAAAAPTTTSPPTTIAANGAVLIPSVVVTSTVPAVRPRAGAAPTTARPAASLPPTRQPAATPPPTAAPTTAAPRPASCTVSTAGQQARGSQQTFTVRATNSSTRSAQAALYAGNGSGGPRWTQSGVLDSSNSWTGSYTVDETQTPGTTYTIRASIPDATGRPVASCSTTFTLS